MKASVSVKLTSGATPRNFNLRQMVGHLRTRVKPDVRTARKNLNIQTLSEASRDPSQLRRSGNSSNSQNVGGRAERNLFFVRDLPDGIESG
ncbi:MAG: hypothetical protein JWP89_5558 [Schlesneria sp.]|nr:hypothetical protein [Schlesneria sp.]